MASLEDQIRTLLESRNTKVMEKEKADRVEEDPAVKIDNPMDPNLSSSEGLTPDQKEEEKASGADRDANEREVAAKKKAEEMREEAEPGAEGSAADNFEDAKEQAMATDVNGDPHGDSLAQVQAVQNETDVDESDADAEARFELAKDKAAEEEQEVQADLGELLGAEFTEDFKLKAKTIFEAAVKAQVSAIKAKLEEGAACKQADLEKEFEEKLARKTKQLEEETSEKIDGYLTYVAEEWTTKNELALQAGIKTELTESFINKLKAVFEEHYIEVPESKVDLYTESLAEKAELEQSLSTSIGTIQSLKEELNQLKRANIIEESSKEFASLDASRFKTLVEDFEFEDEVTFKKKVQIVKTSFFENKSNAKEQLTEEFVKAEVITESNIEPQEPVQQNSRMSAYLSALAK